MARLLSKLYMLFWDGLSDDKDDRHALAVMKNANEICMGGDCVSVGAVHSARLCHLVSALRGVCCRFCDVHVGNP